MIRAPVAPIAPPSVGVAMPRKIVPRTRKISSSGRHQRRQYAQQESAAAQLTRFERQGGHPAGLEDGHQNHIADVEQGQRQTGDEGAGVHVANRFAELVGHDDQHQRRWDDLGQRSRRGDDTRRKLGVVAVAQHDRQRNQAHRDHGSGDHTGGRREQRPDKDHREGETAAQRPEKLSDGVEQVLGHARTFENQPHEGKEGNGQQGVVAHDAEDAVRQRLEQLRPEQTEFDTDESKEDAVGRQREGHRETDEQEKDHRGEDDRGHVGDHEFGHHSSPFWALMASASSSSGVGLCPFAVESGQRPCRKPMRLISSEIPWITSRKKPIGTSRRTGHTVRPPALLDCSLLANASRRSATTGT
jgi:hypothetical protein